MARRVKKRFFIRHRPKGKGTRVSEARFWSAVRRSKSGKVRWRPSGKGYSHTVTLTLPRKRR